MTDLPAGWVDVDLDAADTPAVYRFERDRQRALVARFLAGAADPEAAHARSLARTLDAALGTPFAEQHGLAAVRTLADYQDAVPVRSFAEVEADLARTLAGEGVLTRFPIRGFLLTSGTTAAPKRVPLTDASLADVRDAAALWVLAVVREYPELARGAVLAALGFPGDAAAPHSMTGLLYASAPLAARERNPVPAVVDAIVDPEIRGYTALRLALGQDVRGWLVANPAVVLATCRSMRRWQDDLAADLADGTLVRGPAAALDDAVRRRCKPLLHRTRVPSDFRPAAFWRLGAIHGWTGGSAPHAIAQIAAAIGAEVPVREIGVGASEGLFAIGLHTTWRGGVVVPDGVLIELIPVDGGAAIPVHHGEIGRSYRLIVSTAGGLYRYDMEDIVRIEGRWRELPVISFVRKTSEVISMTGEKVTAAQLGLAMLAVGSTGRFAVAGRLAAPASLVVAVEGVLPRGELVDQALRAVNLEYDQRRATGRLGPIEVVGVDPAVFDGWFAARVAAGAAPAQVKDRVIVPWNDLKWHVTSR